MAWFRVELHKDGSVATSECVGPSSGDKGTRIFYIEAESETFAITKALSRYHAYLTAQREQMSERRAARKAANECRDCGAPLAGAKDRGRGRIRCEECAKRGSDLHHRGVAPNKQGVITPRVQELKLQRMGRSQRATILGEVLEAAISMKAGVRFISWLRAERDAAEGGKATAAE